MDLPDRTLLAIARRTPHAVPLRHVERLLRIGTDEDRSRVLEAIPKRKPRNEEERELLLWLALRHKRGGVLFADALGAFDGLRIT